MKIISLTDYKKLLPKDIVKRAEKMVVRELDEIKTGNYESYVDEGSVTFDVTLSTNEVGKILKSSCDCEDGVNTYCIHKVAVIMSIAEKRKVGSKTVKVKANPTQLLLQDVNVEKLKDWVWELLQKNKDLEMAFTHQFSTKSNEFVPDEIVKITNDATKVISKNKKNIEISELKKLVDLWHTLHEPIINQYLTDVTNELYFSNVHAILDTIKIYRNKINTNSVKINNYADEIYQKIRIAIQTLFSEIDWLKAIKYFLTKSDNNLQTLKDDYFNFLITLIPVDNENRKLNLINLLIKTHKQSLFTESYFLTDRQAKILDLAVAGNVFNEYFEIFKLNGYENNYNLKLIKLLIENNKIELSEKYCNDQILKNYYAEYSTPYHILLKEIYIKSNNQKKLNEVREKLLPITFDYSDYVLIFSSLKSDLEKKNFRSTILTKAKRAAQNGKYNSIHFCLKLLNEEKKYVKMVELINNYTPFSLINEYFESMFLAGKEVFMKALLTKNDASFGYSQFEQEKESIFYPLILEQMKLHFKPNFIALSLRDHVSKSFYYNKSNFIRYLQNLTEDEYRED